MLGVYIVDDGEVGSSGPAMEPEDTEPPEKRRKIRKGTKSCWECKRRKVRCTYASPDDAVCIGCTRRAIECVSQEFPEQTASPLSRSRLVGDRFMRVEAMVERLTKQAGQGQLSPPSFSSRSSTANPGREDVVAHGNGTLTPVSCDTPAPMSASSSHATPIAEAAIHCPANYIPPTPPEWSQRPYHAGRQGLPTDRQTCKLSESLLAVYPSWQDVDIIVNSAGKVAAHFIALTTWDRVEPEITESRTDNLKFMRTRLTAASHPISVTRQMLMLAVVTQFISPELDREALKLSEPLSTIQERLVETAARLSLSTHELTDTGTVDGLECIIIDGMYQANRGNLRRAWLSWRRAIGTAQLMGMSRPHRESIKAIDPSRKINAASFWFRLMWVDRYLCLFLGLPQASTDQSMISAANLKNATLVNQLERRQCVIAGRIVDRNERDPSADDSAETRAIDEMLQEAAGKMPSRWWLVPNLAAINDEEDLLEEISRLQSQMIHYNLLNLLHLPYILHSTLPSATNPEYCTHQYSRITCVNASRDLLKSYVMFRTWNRIACCCRVVDYFALMASMTLLVAHIDSHNMMRARRASANDKSPDHHNPAAINILAHQRMPDRALMEEALDSMTAVAALNNDALNTKSADVLRQLLVIENEAAQVRAPVDNDSGKHVLRMEVPHFGIITIDPNGAVRKDVGDPTQTQNLTAPLVVHSFPADNPLSAEAAVRSGAETDTTPRSEAHPGAQHCHSAAASAVPQPVQMPPSVTMAGHKRPAPTTIDPSGGAGGLAASGQLMTNNPDGALTQANALQQPLPGLTAGAEQWAFQGVDMTFFNSLMREIDMQPEGEPNNWWPLPDLPGNV